VKAGLLGRSRIGLGCATLGREVGEEDSFRILDHAFASGITLFDTAEAYGGGQAREYRRKHLGVDDVRESGGEMHSSEKILGRWLRSRGVRNQVTLLTKVLHDYRRERVRTALEASLDRLQTGAVDIYLFHAFDADTPYEEAAAAAADALASGRVRAMGCSNYSGAQLEKALRHGRLDVVENNYNLAVRDIEHDVLPLARREGLGVITYSPLAAGFLMGKYTSADRAAIPKGTRFDVIPGHADIYFHPRNFEIVDRLGALARRTGVPAARIAVAWVLRNRLVDVVLVGARTVAHVENALAATTLDFEDAWASHLMA
jgi:aryl-alcohol dehydrogenase-like predicted oxidoreductase